MDIDRAVRNRTQRARRAGQGHPRRRRDRAARSRSASTRSASSPPRTTGAPTARCCSPPPGVGDYISGVILFDETIRQSAADGTPFPKLLAATRASSPASRSTPARSRSPLADGETVTEGLDGLRERLAEYHALGARFAKWRATYTITDDAAVAATASTSTRTRSRATPRCARKRASCRSSSPRC